MMDPYQLNLTSEFTLVWGARCWTMVPPETITVIQRIEVTDPEGAVIAFDAPDAYGSPYTQSAVVVLDDLEKHTEPA